MRPHQEEAVLEMVESVTEHFGRNRSYESDENLFSKIDQYDNNLK
jgi:hypothetical protein